MPRDGNGVYSEPPGTTATPNTTILSAAYNAFLADIVADLNAARPITAGGTGLNTLGAKETVLRVNSAGSALEFSPYAPYPSGHLYGLTLSNNGSDAIDIAVGTARSSDDSANIDLASALTKRSDASWVVGTGNGGMDTGSIADGLNYIWLIKRPDTGVVDGLISASASSPTMPTNYTLKAIIGEFNRVGGVNQKPRYYSRAKPGYDWELISTASPSSVASVDFTGLSAFRKLRISGFLKPATDGAFPFLRTSTDNGSNYDAGAGNYVIQWTYSSGATVASTEATSTGYLFGLASTGVGNATEEGIAFTVHIDNFNQATRCWFNGDAYYRDTADAQQKVNSGGNGLDSTARNALRLVFSSGNIAAGFVTLEGIRG